MGLSEDISLSRYCPNKEFGTAKFLRLLWTRVSWDSPEICVLSKKKIKKNEPNPFNAI